MALNKRAKDSSFMEYAREHAAKDDERRELSQTLHKVASTQTLQQQQKQPQSRMHLAKALLQAAQVAYIKRSLPNYLTVSDITIAAGSSWPSLHQKYLNLSSTNPTTRTAASPHLIPSSDSSDLLYRSRGFSQIRLQRSDVRTNPQDTLRNSLIIEPSLNLPASKTAFSSSWTLPFAASNQPVEHEISIQEHAIPKVAKELVLHQNGRTQALLASAATITHQSTRSTKSIHLQDYKIISKLALDQFYSNLDTQKMSINFTPSDAPLVSSRYPPQDTADRKVVPRCIRNQLVSQNNYSVTDSSNIAREMDQKAKKQNEENSFIFHDKAKNLSVCLNQELPYSRERIERVKLLREHRQHKSGGGDFLSKEFSNDLEVADKSLLQQEESNLKVEAKQHRQLSSIQRQASPISLFVKRARNFNEELKERLCKGMTATVNKEGALITSKQGHFARKTQLINNLRATRTSIGPRMGWSSMGFNTQDSENPQSQANEQHSMTNFNRSTTTTSTGWKKSTQTMLSKSIYDFNDMNTMQQAKRINNSLTLVRASNRYGDVLQVDGGVGCSRSSVTSYLARKSAGFKQLNNSNFSSSSPPPALQVSSSQTTAGCSDISDHFNDMLERVQYVIQTNPFFHQMIEQKLNLNVQQFLYLLCYFWRACLTPKPIDSVSESGYFVIDEEYLNCIKKAMQDALSQKLDVIAIDESQLYKEKIDCFMNMFSEQSARLLVPKNLIEHIGGERQIAKLFKILLERFSTEVFIGDQFQFLLRELDVDECIRTVCAFLRDEKDSYCQAVDISAVRTALNITSAEFFFSKRVLLEVISADSLIKQIHRMKILERFERLRSELLQDLTIKQLSTDEKVISMFLVNMRNAKLISRANTFDMGAFLSNMLFGTTTLTEFSAKALTEFKCIDVIGQMNVFTILQRIVVDVINEVAQHFEDQEILLKHCKARFQLLISSILPTSKLHNLSVFTRGAEIASDLSQWATANFDAYPRHIQLTSDENARLDFMRFFLSLYFYREADVFSYLDIPPARKYLPYTDTAVRFWVHGLSIILQEEKYLIDAEQLDHIITDICDILDLDESAKHFPPVSPFRKSPSKKSKSITQQTHY